MKYHYNIIWLTLLFVLFNACKKENRINIEEESIENPEFIMDKECQISAIVSAYTLINSNTQEATTYFDTLNYYYNDKQQLVKREVSSSEIDSLTYNNNKIAKIYKIISGNESQSSEFSYYTNGKIASTTNLSEFWFGAEVDSFFYNDRGLITKIATYREYYFNVEKCDDLSLKQEHIFVYDPNNELLLRDTFKVFHQCDENLRIGRVTVTTYSIHTQAKNPLFNSPFRMQIPASISSVIIGRNDFKAYEGGQEVAMGFSSIDIGSIKINEYGYPSGNYLYNCE